MKREFIILLFFVTFIYSSCYKDINMDKYYPNPDLVLNGVVSADTVVMLSISRTKFFTDTNHYEIINDAEVSLFVNGIFYEYMQWTMDSSFYGGGVYMSYYKPQTGDIIKIEAATKYGNAWVEDSVPAKVRIEDVAFSHRLLFEGKGFGVDENGNIVEIPTMEITYRITFTDDAAVKNYYLIRVENPLPYGFGNLDFSSEPVFVDQVSVIDGLFGDNSIPGQGGRAFSDHLLNGQRYTLVVKESQSSNSPFYDYAPALGRKLILYAITESYYNYLMSMQMSADSENNTNLSTFGFAEPVRIFSNINGGVGIIATSQYDATLIDLKDIL